MQKYSLKHNGRSARPHMARLYEKPQPTPSKWRKQTSETRRKMMKEKKLQIPVVTRLTRLTFYGMDRRHQIRNCHMQKYGSPTIFNRSIVLCYPLVAASALTPNNRRNPLGVFFLLIRFRFWHSIHRAYRGSVRFNIDISTVIIVNKNRFSHLFFILHPLAMPFQFLPS